MVSGQGLPDSSTVFSRIIINFFLLFLVMGKDLLVLDVISDDLWPSLMVNLEDLVNPVDRQKINYLSSSYLQ